MPKNKTDWTLYGIIIILAIIFLGFEYARCGDFYIYLEAAKDIVAGKNIYKELYGNAKVFPYMGSPTLALLLSPLTKSTFLFASLFWKFINLILVFRIWKLIEKYLSDFRLSKNDSLLLLVFSFASVSFLIYRNFHLVQFTIFLLYSILESLYQIRNRKYPLYGVLILALGIITKLLPLVVIPYLVFRGYWKSVLSVSIVLLILVLFPAIFLGWERNIGLYQEWLFSINPMNENNVFDVSTRSIHGIAALISTLTIEGIGNSHSLPIKRNILNLNPDIVRFLIISTKLSLIIATFYFLKAKLIFTDHSKKLNQLWELSYILLITPLVFPQQRSYAFLFIFPCLVYLLFGFIKNSNFRKPEILLLFGIGILLLNMDLLLGQFREYYWHFKTLTYGTLIMLGLLFWTTPSKISLSSTKNAEEK